MYRSNLLWSSPSNPSTQIGENVWQKKSTIAVANRDAEPRDVYVLKIVNLVMISVDVKVVKIHSMVLIQIIYQIVLSKI